MIEFNNVNKSQKPKLFYTYAFVCVCVCVCVCVHMNTYMIMIICNTKNYPKIYCTIEFDVPHNLYLSFFTKKYFSFLKLSLYNM